MLAKTKQITICDFLPQHKKIHTAQIANEKQFVLRQPAIKCHVKNSAEGMMCPLTEYLVFGKEKGFLISRVIPQLHKLLINLDRCLPTPVFPRFTLEDDNRGNE